MVKYLLRSIGIGLLAAIAIISLTPELRNNVFSFHSSQSPNNAHTLQLSFTQAVRKAAPAVVNIYSRQYSQNNRTKLTTQGLGSGVIINAKGYIITNYHVIADADQIIVALQDGRIAAAQLVGKDRRTDIAVLRIEGTNLPVIPQNPNYHPQVGDVVLAIGNPYNLGQTTTLGIISATGRSSISADGHQAFIQTDAAINEGNSGGALVNSQGELVGINTASFQQNSDIETYGISFAIPYALAHTIMEKLIADGRVIRGYIGIEGRKQVVNSLASRLLANQNISGIIVEQVTSGSPAEQAGIRSNDFITKINNQKVNDFQKILDLITSLRPGTTIQVELYRRGQMITLPVTIAEAPDE